VVFLKELFVHSRLVIESFEIGFTRELDQVVVALQIGCQEDQVVIVVVSEEPFALPAIARSKIGFTSNDGFYALGMGFLVKINGTKEVAVVRHGDGGLAKFSNLRKQRVQLVGAIKEAVVRVEMKVDEFGLGGHRLES